MATYVAGCTDIMNISNRFRNYFMVLLHIDGFLESLLPSSITRLLIVLHVKRSDVIKGDRKWLMSIERELFGRLGVIEELHMAGIDAKIIGKDLNNLRDYVWNKKEYNEIPLGIWLALWRPTKVASNYRNEFSTAQTTVLNAAHETITVVDPFHIPDLCLPSTFIRFGNANEKIHHIQCNMDNCDCTMKLYMMRNQLYRRYAEFIAEPTTSPRTVPNVELINSWFKYSSCSPIANLLYLYNPGNIHSPRLIQRVYLKNLDIICDRTTPRHNYNPNSFTTVYTSEELNWNIRSVNSITRLGEIRTTRVNTDIVIRVVPTDGIRITFANEQIEYRPDKYESCFIPSS